MTIGLRMPLGHLMVMAYASGQLDPSKLDWFPNTDDNNTHVLLLCKTKPWLEFQDQYCRDGVHLGSEVLTRFRLDPSKLDWFPNTDDNNTHVLLLYKTKPWLELQDQYCLLLSQVLPPKSVSFVNCGGGVGRILCNNITFPNTSMSSHTCLPSNVDKLHVDGCLDACVFLD
ncbi:hypothetical protein BJV82DRAFT_386046 [Fennellomyces sp. T-0311]|nr:hypothetical protein BJV82DRAFT_386046 [Fennellomyces sp. T-0311]